jgi:phytoene dehydrogenase-like protein
MKTAHSMDEYLAVIESGIRSRFPEGKPKQVVIVGAGMAGLVAGYELKRAGHTPIIPGGAAPRRRVESILQESTLHCIMHGTRGPLNQDCGRRSQFTARRRGTTPTGVCA